VEALLTELWKLCAACCDAVDMLSAACFTAASALGLFASINATSGVISVEGGAVAETERDTVANSDMTELVSRIARSWWTP